MAQLQDIFNRVANWNSKRYEQEYNHQLAVSLLREEYNEWRTDKELVKKLDGLCDVVFVALGILWKAKTNFAELDAVINRSFVISGNLTDAWELTPGYFIGSTIDMFEVEPDYPIDQAMMNIIVFATTQALSMGLTVDQFMQAVLVVCDSNDSKSIKKVASNVKANAGDKGAYFIPPEPRLQAILNKAEVFND